MDRRSLLSTTFLLLSTCLAGCNSRDGLVELDDVQIEEFSRLTAARQSGFVPLIEQLDQLVTERATPELLIQDRLPDEQNVATALASLYDSGTWAQIKGETESLFEADAFQFSPAQLSRATMIAQRNAPRIDQIEEALRRPACQFPIDFRRGFFIETDFIDTTKASVRLLAFRAAGQLADDPSSAVDSLRSTFQLIGWLAAERHVESRLTAAELRAEALQIVQAIARHPQCSRQELTALAGIVEEQLAAWPEDAEAWIGDRAVTLHGYEVVRAGGLGSILTEAEETALRKERLISRISDHLDEWIDRDQHYYLQAMQRLLEACRKPFYQRRTLFGALRYEHHDMQDQKDFPLIATRLFLFDIEEGQAVQARDRARCEAWSLALAAAAGLERPQHHINPYSGGEYRVEVQENTVTVWMGDMHQRDIVIPQILASASPEASVR